MSHDQPGYGLWMLVILNSAVFLMFAFSFFKPQTGRDWRTFGAFAAFVVVPPFHGISKPPISLIATTPANVQRSEYVIQGCFSLTGSKNALAC